MSGNERKISVGDSVLYKYYFGIIEAKVLNVYDGGFIKIRKIGFLSFMYETTEIIPVEEVLDVIPKGGD